MAHSKKKNAKELRLEAQFRFERSQEIDDYLNFRRVSQKRSGVFIGRQNLFETIPLALFREVDGIGFERSALNPKFGDFDAESADKLALELLRAIASADSLKKRSLSTSARLGRAIAPSAISKIAYLLVLAALDDPECLSLDSWHLAMRAALLPRRPSSERKLDNVGKPVEALSIGAELFLAGQRPSIRAVAKRMRVAPSTISRWFPNHDFDAQVRTRATRYSTDQKRGR